MIGASGDSGTDADCDDIGDGGTDAVNDDVCDSGTDAESEDIDDCGSNADGDDTDNSGTDADGYTGMYMLCVYAHDICCVLVSILVGFSFQQMFLLIHWTVSKHLRFLMLDWILIGIWYFNTLILDF